MSCWVTILKNTIDTISKDMMWLYKNNYSFLNLYCIPSLKFGFSDIRVGHGSDIILHQQRFGQKILYNLLVLIIDFRVFSEDKINSNNISNKSTFHLHSMDIICKSTKYLSVTLCNRRNVVLRFNCSRINLLWLCYK